MAGCSQPDAAGLDILVQDASGNFAEWIYGEYKPQWGGGNVTLAPGETYYLSVIGWVGTPSSSPTYELQIEQLAAP